MTKARKDYRCDLCEGPIPAGSDYVRVDVAPWEDITGEIDGFQTAHYHGSCHGAMLACRLDPEEYWPDNQADFAELLRECEIPLPWEDERDLVADAEGQP